MRIRLYRIIQLEDKTNPVFINIEFTSIPKGFAFWKWLSHRFRIAVWIYRGDINDSDWINVVKNEMSL